MADVPEHLLKRAADARAQADGTPAGGGAAVATAVATMPVGDGPVRDLDAEATQYGVPRGLLERGMFARSKADGTPVPQMAGAAPVAAAAAPAAAAAGNGGAPAVAGPPPGVRTQRLLTVVKANAIQGTSREPQDKVNVWPHLLAIEFVALLAMSALLFLMSAFIDAPLLEFANFNSQPNPSKAPWYFLGLQELLAYFDPMVAGVIIPGFGLAALAFVPYVDRNPSTRPADRKLAISIFTVFFMAAAVLTIFGSFFRGPGFNFTFPWRDGIFFDDLLTILE
ncbi:MAG: menaquinol-cytochrome c reductase cytochrome b subunit [Acidimicrobiia bacterium]